MNKFVSEKQILENREKFGIPTKGEDQHYDPRPLYEKLQEKRALEDEEYQSKYKSKGPKVLDEEEYEFLHGQDNITARMEKEIAQQDAALLEQFTSEQSHLSVPNIPAIPPKTTSTPQETPMTSIIKPSQRMTLKKKKKKTGSILRSCVVKKTIQKKSKEKALSPQDEKSILNVKTQEASSSSSGSTKKTTPSPLAGFLANY